MTLNRIAPVPVDNDPSGQIETCDLPAVGIAPIVANLRKK
jgi:hypothetical protein